jgi:hypothetical protein
MLISKLETPSRSVHLICQTKQQYFHNPYIKINAYNKTFFKIAKALVKELKSLETSCYLTI